MNGNYPYSEERAYKSESLSLKRTLIKSSDVIIKQLQTVSVVTGRFLSEGSYLDTVTDKMCFWQVSGGSGHYYRLEQRSKSYFQTSNLK